RVADAVRDGRRARLRLCHAQRRLRVHVDDPDVAALRGIRAEPPARARLVRRRGERRRSPRLPAAASPVNGLRGQSRRATAASPTRAEVVLAHRAGTTLYSRKSQGKRGGENDHERPGRSDRAGEFCGAGGARAGAARTRGGGREPAEGDGTSGSGGRRGADGPADAAADGAAAGQAGQAVAGDDDRPGGGDRDRGAAPGRDAAAPADARSVPDALRPPQGDADARGDHRPQERHLLRDDLPHGQRRGGAARRPPVRRDRPRDPRQGAGACRGPRFREDWRPGPAPPKGLLLYGPPGTGKTKLAQALATASGAIFYHLKLTNLTSKFGVNTGELLQEILRIVTSEGTAVLFLDEAEALSLEHLLPPPQAREASARLVAALCEKLDAMEPSTRVLIV